jgi:uncharacterized Fe-S center protein
MTDVEWGGECPYCQKNVDRIKELEALSASEQEQIEDMKYTIEHLEAENARWIKFITEITTICDCISNPEWQDIMIRHRISVGPKDELYLQDRRASE